MGVARHHIWPRAQDTLSESTQGVLFLAVAAVGSALLCHTLIRNDRRSSLIAAVLAATIFEAGAYLHLGYFDPMTVFAFVTCGFIAYVAARRIGIPFRIHRKA